MALQFRSIFLDFALSLILLLQTNGYLKSENDSSGGIFYTCSYSSLAKTSLIITFFAIFSILLLSLLTKCYIRIRTKSSSKPKIAKTTIAIAYVSQFIANSLLLLELIYTFLLSDSLCRPSSLTFWVVILGVFLEYVSSIMEVLENKKEAHSLLYDHDEGL